MDTDIFISYSRQDSEHASALAHHLRKAGVAVWMDQDGTYAGSAWAGEIIQAIEQCRVFLLLLSPTSAASDQVFREVSFASDSKKQILPVRLEPVHLSGRLQYHLAGIQYLDLRPGCTEELDIVLDALRRLGVRVGGQKSTEAAPSTERVSAPPAPRPASGDPFAAAKPEPVLLGASAPQSVRAGDEFTARFVAYIPALEPDLRAELGRLSPRSTAHLGLKRCQWQPGTQVKVKLSSRALSIEPNEQEFVWEGTRNVVEFDVAVPKDAIEDTVVLRFDALIDGITVAIIRLDLQIAVRQSELQTGCTVSSATKAARSAFASYSSEDRQRVLDRVAAVRISAGLDIFLDCLSLNPGEQWKLRLAGEIRRRDLFLLFWSLAASQSPWVRWEWRTALAERGKHIMQIHPLEVGVKPPEELHDLHFDDSSMAIRGGYAAPTRSPAPPQ